MQEAGCDAVKPQGGKSQQDILAALVDAGIPTASHIGLTPHRVAMFGGFRIQVRTPEETMEILEDAHAIQDAGCFILEFEAVPADIARLISLELEIPTIGIGAGAGTDGQNQLSYDLLGVFAVFETSSPATSVNAGAASDSGTASDGGSDGGASPDAGADEPKAESKPRGGVTVACQRVKGGRHGTKAKRMSRQATR